MWTIMPSDHGERGKLTGIFLSAFTAWFQKEVQPLRSRCLPICSFLYHLWNSLANFNQL